MRRDPGIAQGVAHPIVDPDKPGRYLQIRGRVRRFVADGAVAHNNALAKKYTGLDEYPGDRPGDIHVIAEIAPVRVAWLD